MSFADDRAGLYGFNINLANITSHSKNGWTCHQTNAC